MSTDGKEKPMMDKNSYKPLQERISDVVEVYARVYENFVPCTYIFGGPGDGNI